MSSIFEKNINALAQKDKELAQKIATHILTDVPQPVNENGFYNIIYKNIYLHNKENPLAEAQEIFFRAENTPVTISVIYGLGLGYLFQIAAGNSQGTVILYEPDLNILYVVFRLVDFSEYILKKNVYIASSIEKCGEYIYMKSNTKNTPLVLSTPAYRTLDETKFNSFVEKLLSMVGSYELDLKYTKQRFYPLIVNMLANIPQLVKEPPLSSIKDFYKGNTAVVVSAGPTLDRNIETIKKYRDNIVLIVVGTAMKTLARHNIKPDFLCIIEAYDSSKQIEGLDLSDVNFITEPYSHPNLRKFRYKNIFSHIAANMPINTIWGNMIKENLSEYWSKGTVSYTAINVARILGCSEIVLVGQDLAYIEGQCYSKDSAYKDLECRYNNELKRWEIVAKDFNKFVDAISNATDLEARKRAASNRLINLNKSLYYVKGINGDKIPTESVYAAFVKPLTEYTEMFPDINYINTSLVGAQIDGFKNMPLEDALKDTAPIVNGNVSADYKFDIPEIKKELDEMLKLLACASKDVENGQSILKSLKNDLKRYKNVTAAVLKTLKKLSVHYYGLAEKYKNSVYGYITAGERIDIEYEMKMAKEFTPEVINTIEEKFALYYARAVRKITVVEKTIKQTIGELE